VLQSHDHPRRPLLDRDAWTGSLRELGARYTPAGIEPKSFAGWVRPIRIGGLAGLDLGCNAAHVERTAWDIRLDGKQHYFALFQVAGHATMEQNDRLSQLVTGDVAIVDSARPVVYVPRSEDANWLTLQLPRRSLACHLGFEPVGGIRAAAGTAAGKLLHQIVADALAGERPTSPQAECYMQLAVYDLLGALFAPSDPVHAAPSTDKLFARVCVVMRERFSDPEFGPSDVAGETGISLRYVQKLFKDRGTTCTQFLYSLRLDRAAQLVSRRAQVGRAQPLSQIAYACGYNDYTHFARNFRRRFGHSPGRLAAAAGPGSGDESFRAMAPD
jgi:AraC-like DNA-binding protein